MRYTELRPGDSLVIGAVRVTLVEKSGQRARLSTTTTTSDVQIRYEPARPEQKKKTGDVK